MFKKRFHKHKWYFVAWSGCGPNFTCSIISECVKCYKLRMTVKREIWNNIAKSKNWDYYLERLKAQYRSDNV